VSFFSPTDFCGIAEVEFFDYNLSLFGKGFWNQCKQTNTIGFVPCPHVDQSRQMLFPVDDLYQLSNVGGSTMNFFITRLPSLFECDTDS
jgi:hypothetical protein